MPRYRPRANRPTDEEQEEFARHASRFSTPIFKPASLSEGGTRVDIYRLAEAGQERELRMLLDMCTAAGEPVAELINAPDPASGSTPLQAASFAGNFNCVELLLQRGARIDQVNNLGWAPLMLAARYGGANTVRVLLHFRAEVSLALPDGKTALDLAFAARRELESGRDESGRPGSSERLSRGSAVLDAAYLLQHAEDEAWEEQEKDESERAEEEARLKIEEVEETSGLSGALRQVRDASAAYSAELAAGLDTTAFVGRLRTAQRERKKRRDTKPRGGMVDDMRQAHLRLAAAPPQPQVSQILEGDGDGGDDGDGAGDGDGDGDGDGAAAPTGASLSRQASLGRQASLQRQPSRTLSRQGTLSRRGSQQVLALLARSESSGMAAAVPPSAPSSSSGLSSTAILSESTREEEEEGSAAAASTAAMADEDAPLELQLRLAQLGALARKIDGSASSGAMTSGMSLGVASASTHGEDDDGGDGDDDDDDDDDDEAGAEAEERRWQRQRRRQSLAVESLKDAVELRVSTRRPFQQVPPPPPSAPGAPPPPPPVPPPSATGDAWGAPLPLPSLGFCASPPPSSSGVAGTYLVSPRDRVSVAVPSSPSRPPPPPSAGSSGLTRVARRPPPPHMPPTAAAAAAAAAGGRSPPPRKPPPGAPPPSRTRQAQVERALRAGDDDLQPAMSLRGATWAAIEGLLNGGGGGGGGGFGFGGGGGGAGAAPMPPPPSMLRHWHSGRGLETVGYESIRSEREENLRSLRSARTTGDRSTGDRASGC